MHGLYGIDLWGRPWAMFTREFQFELEIALSPPGPLPRTVSPANILGRENGKLPPIFSPDLSGETMWAGPRRSGGSLGLLFLVSFSWSLRVKESPAKETYWSSNCHETSRREASPIP